MKYLLLDTNIYLNIIVNRRKDINQSLIENFMKLLKYGEIKLIIPSLIKHEVYKHLEQEIDKVKLQLESNIRSLKQIYWINGLADANAMVDIETIKKEAITPLNATLAIFEENVCKYKESSKLLLDKIFEDENTVLIEDDHSLITKALQRQIYKKAPCHIEGKNSVGDALIAEVLINLPNYVHEILEPDEASNTVYFVTDNYKDFSSSKEPPLKEVLHPHISNDLTLTSPQMNYKYFTSLSKLIAIDLQEEVKNAHLSEEFEQDLKEEEYISECEYWDEYEANTRESCGLPSLSSFDYLLEQEIESNSDVDELLTLFESINETYTALEEQLCEYYDIIDNLESLKNTPDEMSIIERFNQFLVELQERDHCYTLDDVIDWIESKKGLIEIDYCSVTLPDSFSIGEDVSITINNSKILHIHWKNTDITPSNGDQDCIELECFYNPQSILSYGTIEIDYGFAELDDEGRVGDASDYSIDICFSDIISSVKVADEKILELSNTHTNYLNFLSNDFI